MKRPMALAAALSVVWALCAAPADVAGADDHPVLVGRVRDLRAGHPPDFEGPIAVDPGIVADHLGADRTPVYAHGEGGTATTSGPDAFALWYHDVPGVNRARAISLDLSLVPGSDPPVYRFADPHFFPIDGQLLGNEGREHNYHFTLESHHLFTYRGGETFHFWGDDDVWVFINGILAVDLGGVHGAMDATLDLDAEAQRLGLEPGGAYPFDFFFAERHTTESRFQVDTTLELRRDPAFDACSERVMANGAAPSFLAASPDVGSADAAVLEDPCLIEVMTSPAP